METVDTEQPLLQQETTHIEAGSTMELEPQEECHEASSASEPIPISLNRQRGHALCRLEELDEVLWASEGDAASTDSENVDLSTDDESNQSGWSPLSVGEPSGPESQDELPDSLCLDES